MDFFGWLGETGLSVVLLVIDLDIWRYLVLFRVQEELVLVLLGVGRLKRWQMSQLLGISESRHRNCLLQCLIVLRVALSHLQGLIILPHTPLDNLLHIRHPLRLHANQQATALALNALALFDNGAQLVAAEGLGQALVVDLVVVHAVQIWQCLENLLLLWRELLRGCKMSGDWGGRA